MVKALLKLLLLFSLLSVSLGANAQVLNVNLQTFTNEAVSHTFLSRAMPALSFDADFGAISLAPTGIPFQYEFTYTPDPDYVGPDEVRYLYFPMELPNTFALLRYNINVIPLILDANHDIGSTLQGNSISIPVLDNDFSSTGVLNLVAAPVTNAGTTQINGDNIVFTPAPGFTGLADFNYVVCAFSDGYDLCKTGTVSINVLSTMGAAASDTTHVFTKRYSVNNPGALILAPSNYSLVNAPVNGTYDVSGDIPVYRPIPGHIGTEYLNYTNGSDNIVYRVETLDLINNEFTTDDQAYTTLDSDVTINVLQNDLFGSFSDCISFQPPVFGSLTPGNNPGQITYSPPAGWSGVDRFTYTAFPLGCVGEGETATVTIVVSDFRPAASEFSLTTATNVALPFTYEAPGDNVSWSVVDPPSLGTVSSDPAGGGLIYTPGVDVAGTDQLTVRYCLEGPGGDCQITEDVSLSITIMATGNDVADCGDEEDCVWPGDTNLDGIVDISDLLPIGFHMGSAGTPRTSADPGSWAPQYAEDWNEEDNGVNRKHVDANGDQFITSLDTQVVRNNLGMISRIYPDPLPIADYDIILDGDIFVEPGDIAQVRVSMGTNFIGIEDIVGFIFPFSYDTTFVDASSVTLEYASDSWMSYDSPVMSMQFNDQQAGYLQSAYVRTSGIATSGYGEVATLYIGIEDIVGFITEPGSNEPSTISTTIGGDLGESMDAGGHRSGVRVQPLDITIVSAPTISQPGIDQGIESFLDEKLLTFPNPTGGQLTVHLNGQREFTALSLTDITGRTIEQYRGEPTNHRTIDLSAYPNGLYTLRVTTTEGVVNRKIEVIR